MSRLPPQNAEEAIARLEGWIWTLAYRYVKERDWGLRQGLAERFAHDLRVQIFEAFHNYRPNDGALTTWAEWQARHVFLKKSREYLHDRQTQQASQSEELASHVENHPDATSLRGDSFDPEEAEMIRSEVDRLPHETACVIRLRFGLGDGEELPIETVARQLGMKRGRAVDLMRAGLSALRGSMSRCLVTV
jgi:RNA polymerase sigma factor (sigma-70 family)